MFLKWRMTATIVGVIAIVCVTVSEGGSKESMADREALEQKLGEKGIFLGEGDPGFYNRVHRGNKESTTKKAYWAQMQLYEAMELKQTNTKSLQRMTSVAGTAFGSCHEKIHCNITAKYRSVDGVCNNYDNPKWGQAETAFVRLLTPDYSDGITGPRKSSAGTDLPSARTVSQGVTLIDDKPSGLYTHMVMQWGQFLDHDITLTPFVTGSWFALSCCDNGRLRPAEQLHPDCLPISVASDDPFFGKLGQRCMEFTRSIPAPRRDCVPGFREQLNENTAYIDASQIYGSLEHDASFLREHNRGRLRTFETPDGRELLPQDLATNECPTESLPCFRAGDVRVNEQPILTVMHTIWMRQHNLIAGELESLNPHWDDEQLYQEARRIVAAQNQHITYNEFLPVILGEKSARRADLMPMDEGYIFYDETVDASISNAFATAAYRLGHTFIEGIFQGYSDEESLVRAFPLSAAQFANNFIYDEGAIDEMVRGLAIQPCQDFDKRFTTEVRDMLFARNNSFGLDLVALNIQRGRDHGLPSYARFKEACDLGSPQTFDDLIGDMSRKNVRSLQNIYDDVNDIDLFVGGVLEKRKSLQLAGKTFKCILTDQFLRLKKGDRFYYENGDNLFTRFTLEQLSEIRKTSLARVLCDNSEISTMQPRAFFLESKADCSDLSAIPRLDLSKWQEIP